MKSKVGSHESLDDVLERNFNSLARSTIPLAPSM